MRRLGTSPTKAGNSGALVKNANIPIGVRSVLPEECLPQTFHNALTLHCAKLPFPLDLSYPQNSKDHNRCQPDKYCSELIHGSISPQDSDSITGLDVRESY